MLLLTSSGRPDGYSVGTHAVNQGAAGVLTVTDRKDAPPQDRVLWPTLTGVLSIRQRLSSTEEKGTPLYRQRVLAHVSIQCANPATSRAFYEAVLEPLGGKTLLVYGDHVGFGNPDSGPDFWVGPVNTPGGPHDDVHIAFRAGSRAEVDAFVEVARSRGAEVLHEPKEWWYSPGYYGGFVRDPDGNNVEAVHLAKV